MGRYSNNGPSFSGMRTFRMFYRTKREPRTWLNESKSELRPEDRTVFSHRLLKLRATLKAKKQAKELRDARISRLMQGVRDEHARKKKRETRTAQATKKAIQTAKRVTLRKERVRNRRSQEMREIHHRARLREERKQRRLEKTLRQAEKARREAETDRRKAEKAEVERIRVQTALAKQATRDRVKARKLRLNKLLKEIRRKRRG
jgi:hypothetical protein